MSHEYDATREMFLKTRPSVIYKPNISRDGEMWSVLLGNNIQEGVSGFGATPEAAMAAFDTAWITPVKHRRIGPTFSQVDIAQENKKMKAEMGATSADQSDPLEIDLGPEELCCICGYPKSIGSGRQFVSKVLLNKEKTRPIKLCLACQHPATNHFVDFNGVMGCYPNIRLDSTIDCPCNQLVSTTQPAIPHDDCCGAVRS
jgi:hypothetical protein